jgi:hypothetical protein
MWRVPSDLLRIAERIADTENRIDKLRDRVDRLRAEGSDASQADDLLDVTRGMLGQLYAHQSDMRRSAWIISK